jgi:hypothetical protein
VSVDVKGRKFNSFKNLEAILKIMDSSSGGESMHTPAMCRKTRLASYPVRQYCIALSTSIERNVFSDSHSLDYNRGIFYALNCSHLQSPVTSQRELLVLPTKTTWTLAKLQI